MEKKSGFVAIVGRPNVGKSTLLNKILNQKVSIISDKVQTTRYRIRGVLTEERGQVVFVDTPGLHRPYHKLGEFLVEEAKLAIPDADLVIFMADAQAPPGPGDKWIIENILQLDKPMLMILNKIDKLTKKNDSAAIKESYQELFGKKELTTLMVSAETGRNLDNVLKNIFRELPKGPYYYPEEEVTDQNMRAIASEVIREKLLLNTQDELPHSIAVVVDEYKEEPNISRIYATIYVERDSQKGMVIGKKGAMLKKIGTAAREELEEMIESKVYLELTVKVRKKWRKNPSALKEFGYESK